jgi:hypothetical protein
MYYPKVVEHYNIASGFVFTTKVVEPYDIYGIDIPNSPVITSSLVHTPRAGLPTLYQILATNNPTSFNAGDLPDGADMPGNLHIDTSTGIITGTISAGTYSLNIAATNDSGTGTAVLVIVSS